MKLPTLSTLSPSEIWAVVHANRGLCLHCAKHFLGRGLELEDLIQEGYFGLYRGVELFDAGRDLKFSTYVCHWIKQAMQAAVEDKGRTIRIPRHAMVRSKRIVDGKIDLDTLKPKKREWVMRALEARVVLSIDHHYEDTTEHASGSGRDGSNIDVAGPEPDRDPIDPELLEAALAALADLDERSRKVVVGHCVEGKTLAAIGLEFGITRERVRQIERAALKAIRSVVAA